MLVEKIKFMTKFNGLNNVLTSQTAFTARVSPRIRVLRGNVVLLDELVACGDSARNNPIVSGQEFVNLTIKSTIVRAQLLHILTHIFLISTRTCFRGGGAAFSDFTTLKTIISGGEGKIEFWFTVALPSVEPIEGGIVEELVFFFAKPR